MSLLNNTRGTGTGTDRIALSHDRNRQHNMQNIKRCHCSGLCRHKERRWFYFERPTTKPVLQAATGHPLRKAATDSQLPSNASMWPSSRPRDNYLQGSSASEADLHRASLVNHPDNTTSQRPSPENAQSLSVTSNTSPVDRITSLEEQLQCLNSKRLEVSQLLADTAAQKPTAIDLRAYEEWEQRKRSLEDGVAELRRQEHETGIKLHRAWKRRGDEGSFDSAMFVRRRVGPQKSRTLDRGHSFGYSAQLASPHVTEVPSTITSTLPVVSELGDTESFLRTTIDRLNSPFDDRLLQFAHSTQSLNRLTSGTSDLAILSSEESRAASAASAIAPAHILKSICASSDSGFDSLPMQVHSVLSDRRGFLGEVQVPKPEHDISSPPTPDGEIEFDKAARATYNSSDDTHESFQTSPEDQADLVRLHSLNQDTPDCVSNTLVEQNPEQDSLPWPRDGSESFSSREEGKIDNTTTPSTTKLGLDSEVLLDAATRRDSTISSQSIAVVEQKKTNEDVGHQTTAHASEPKSDQQTILIPNKISTSSRIQHDPGPRSSDTTHALQRTPADKTDTPILLSTIDRDPRHYGWCEQHVILGPVDDEVLEVCNMLGQGSLGLVEEVRKKDTQLPTFVRKRVKLPVRKRKAILDIVTEEAANLKPLFHPHIVALIGTYEEQRHNNRHFYCLLMSPVGDNELRDFLELYDEEDNFSNTKKEWNHWLSSWFVCLASALDYMHRKGIRHQDIKPSNIVHKGSKIFFTDFSSSSTFAVGHTTSTDNPSRSSPMYAAPEVMQRPLGMGGLKRHGLSSDIFALGCVFCDMLSVWQGQCLSDFHDYLAQADGVAPGPFRYSDRISMIEKRLKPSQFFTNCILPMLSPDRKSRPTASRILERTLVLDPWRDFDCECINMRSRSGVVALNNGTST